MGVIRCGISLYFGDEPFGLAYNNLYCYYIMEEHSDTDSHMRTDSCTDSSSDPYICCSGKISADRPIEFIRFTSICPTGKTVNILKLACQIEEITINNPASLIGNNLSFTVPRYICGKDKKPYKILQPDVIDIMIQDINNISQNVSIIKSHCKTVYYITISVTESMFCDCKLMLRFCKFNLVLKELECCESKKICKSREEGWKWIPSLIL